MPNTRPEALFTLDALKAYLGTTSGTQDSDLVTLANAVSADLERKTKRVYVTRSFSEVLDGRGTRDIWLREYPVRSVSSLVIKWTFTDDGQTIDPADYTVIAQQGRIVLHVTLAPSNIPGNVAVTYTAGYGAQDHPEADDTLAAAHQLGLDMVKYLLNQKSTGAISVSSLSMQGSNILLKPDWPPSIRDGIAALTRARA